MLLLSITQPVICKIKLKCPYAHGGENFNVSYSTRRLWGGNRRKEEQNSLSSQLDLLSGCHGEVVRIYPRTSDALPRPHIHRHPHTKQSIIQCSREKCRAEDTSCILYESDSCYFECVCVFCPVAALYTQSSACPHLIYRCLIHV